MVPRVGLEPTLHGFETAGLCLLVYRGLTAAPLELQRRGRTLMYRVFGTLGS